jgi:hypothetical protein
MGVISKFNSQISSYVVLGVGLILLFISYLTNAKSKM